MKQHETRDERLEAHDHLKTAEAELRAMEAEAQKLENHFLHLAAAVAGRVYCEVNIGESNNPVFIVYPHGTGHSEKVFFPKCKKVIQMIQKRNALNRTIAEAKQTLERHGLRTIP